MSRRSKREMAPPPLPAAGPSVLPSHAVAPDSSDGVPPPVGQPAWWPGSFPQVTPSGTMSPKCGMEYYPPGGFMSYFQTGQQSFPPFAGSCFAGIISKTHEYGGDDRGHES